MSAPQSGNGVVKFSTKVTAIGAAVLMVGATLSWLVGVQIERALSPVIARMDAMTAASVAADAAQAATTREIAAEVRRLRLRGDVVGPALLYPVGSRERQRAIRVILAEAEQDVDAIKGESP